MRQGTGRERGMNQRSKSGGVAVFVMRTCDAAEQVPGAMERAKGIALLVQTARKKADRQEQSAEAQDKSPSVVRRLRAQPRRHAGAMLARGAERVNNAGKRAAQRNSEHSAAQ